MRNMIQRLLQWSTLAEGRPATVRSMTAKYFLQLAGLRRLQPAYALARRLGLLLLLVGGVCSSAHAQLSETVVTSMGLQTMWQAQLQMPLKSGRIVSTHLWTSANAKERVYAELTWPSGTPAAVMASGRTLRVSADRLGADGQPIGIEAAKQEVETLAMRRLGRPSGLTAKEVRVRVIYFIVLTSDGYVQAYNAETGEKLWSNSCSAPQYPAMPACVSESGLAVTQGPYLHLFDLNTGKELARRHMQRATATGVALANDRAFLSALSGQLTTVEFNAPSTASRWSFRLYGPTLIPPATSNARHHLVAFGTTSGVVTVISSGERVEPWYNFVTQSPLVGPLTFIGDALYVGDVTGQFTKLGVDHVGKMQWRAMLGSALGAQPILIDKTLYVASEVGHLLALDNESGELLWGPTTRCKAILAGTKDRIYCRSLTDRLLAVDAKTGNVIAQTNESLIGTTVANQLTDRVVLISEGGKVQCLRTPGDSHRDPTFMLPLPAATEEASDKKETAPAAEVAAGEATMEAAPADTADPFGASAGAADAFGTPATPPAANDPFATPPAAAAPGADPFQ